MGFYLWMGCDLVPGVAGSQIFHTRFDFLLSTYGSVKGKLVMRSFPHLQMAYRLPVTHSLVPAPANQTRQAPPVVPWRGGIIVSGIRPSDRAGSQEIHVTALEIDGDNKMQEWPSQFIARVLYDRRVLREVLAYIHHYAVPMCTFIADRYIRDSSQSSANEMKFRNLSRVLYENETVAIAPWGTPALPGAGIIIYPAQNSSSLLVGASFLNRSFPDCLGYGSDSTMSYTPTISNAPSMHQQSAPLYTSSMMPPPLYNPSQWVSSQHSSSNSPVETQQEQYSQYVLPTTMAPGYATGVSSPSSAGSTSQWSGDLSYATSSGSGYAHQPQDPSQYH